ncbi:MAG TPA: SDR family oxidoreductase [Anaerolineaceae bacterium]|nr:SDR family oxidoreductase [Anaerolineaceae bacterium]
MSVDFSVKDKVIVITGATGVICSALAKELAGLGAKLVLINRHAESGRALEAEICTSGGEGISLIADVLDKASLLEAREQTLRHFGRVDVLINGAGGNKPEATTSKTKSFFDLDLEAFRDVLDLNLTGAFLTTQVFGEELVKQGKGMVINVASMTSFQPLSNVVAYGAAKAAIVNFTQWMAVHFNENYCKEIRVNAIAPGFLISNQNRFLLQKEDGSPTERGARVLAKTPMRRYGEPSEMVGAVVWLCSDASSFVNGAVIPIDGGFSAASGV